MCAVDDSAKHASEYAKHGIKVFLPKTHYNEEVHNMKNVSVFADPDDIYKKVKSLIKI